MRDIVTFYKHGHIKHAHAATHCGKPIPIGDDAASARVSQYDEERVKRWQAVLDVQNEQKRAEVEEAQARDEAVASALAAAAVAPQASEASKQPPHKKRRKASSTKPGPSSAGDEDADVANSSTDRRGELINMRLLIKWTDGCGVQYVQREAALGTASLYGDTELLGMMLRQQAAAAFGVIGMHIVFEPHCFKFIHDAAGKVFATNKDKGVKGREVTISNVYEHYDYNAATMLKPTHSTFNFGADFSFSNYYHLLYKKENFVELKSDAVVGIKSWRLTEGGTTSRALARSGHSGGLGYAFRSQPHVCFCECNPCKHAAFTGTPSEHTALPSTQQAKDRVIATNYFDTIKNDTPLASKGNLDDSTAGSEPLWLSIAKGKMESADAPFRVGGGVGENGTRTIQENWKFVDIQWLVKIKTDSDGNVHYEAWSQPHGERTVLTKPKIIPVDFEWLRVEESANANTRYVLSAADYERLTHAVRPR